MSRLGQRERGGNGSGRREFLRLSSTLLLLGAVAKPLRLFGRFSSPPPHAAPLSPLPLVERAAFTMGSIVTIKAYHADRRLCDLAIDEAFRGMKSIDSLMSVFDPASALSGLNREAHARDVAVDARITSILDEARRVHRFTEGAFDPTIEPLMEIYGFRDEKSVHRFPADAAIAHAMAAVGMDKVIVDRQASTVRFGNPGTELDLGGIAVGYAVDCAADILRNRGIGSGIINHSGDIYAIGAPPEEDAWTVGITDPGATRGIITTVGIADQALSTSGNYQNFIESDGKTIGHILNPATGLTAREFLSTTVIARTSVEADALSTGLFVVGLRRSRQLLSHSPDIRLIAVVQEGPAETVVEV